MEKLCLISAALMVGAMQQSNGKIINFLRDKILAPYMSRYNSPALCKMTFIALNKAGNPGKPLGLGRDVSNKGHPAVQG